MRCNYSEVFERMLLAGGLHNGSQLARALGITPQAISNYKRRGELPMGLLVRFAEIFSVSVDWLLTGQGLMLRAVSGSNAPAPQSEGAAGAAGPDGPEIRALRSDEVIYIGKLLDILRAPENFAPRAVKVCIDAFLQTASRTGGAGGEGREGVAKIDGCF